MTLSLQLADCGSPGQTPGPDWGRVLGALLVAVLLLLVSGPFYCAVPGRQVIRPVSETPIAHGTTTWSHPTTTKEAG